MSGTVTPLHLHACHRGVYKNFTLFTIAFIFTPDTASNELEKLSLDTIQWALSVYKVFGELLAKPKKNHEDRHSC